MKYILSFLFLIAFGYSNAQTILDKEKELMSDFKKVKYWNEKLIKDYQQITEDSLDDIATIFKNKLLSITSTMPQTMSYNFQGLKNLGVQIIKASDGNFKIYSWEAKTKNGARYIETLYQYKLNRKVFSDLRIKEKETDPGYFCREIFTIRLNMLNTYIALYNGYPGDKNKTLQLKAYELHDTGFKDEIPFFKTATAFENEINIIFNDPIIKSSEDDLILYDETKKTITIPVINEEKLLTKRKIVYKFNGRCFEK